MLIKGEIILCKVNVVQSCCFEVVVGFHSVIGYGATKSLCCIDEMQFGFRPGRGPTDAIFIIRQLQQKYIAKQKE